MKARQWENTWASKISEGQVQKILVEARARALTNQLAELTVEDLMSKPCRGAAAQNM